MGYVINDLTTWGVISYDLKFGYLSLFLYGTVLAEFSIAGT